MTNKDNNKKRGYIKAERHTLLLKRFSRIVNLLFVLLVIMLSSCDKVYKILNSFSAKSEVCKDENVVEELKRVIAHKIYEKEGGVFMDFLLALSGKNRNEIINSISKSLAFEKLIKAEQENDKVYICKAMLRFISSDDLYIVDYKIRLYEDLKNLKFRISIVGFEKIYEAKQNAKTLQEERKLKNIEADAGGDSLKLSETSKNIRDEAYRGKSEKATEEDYKNIKNTVIDYHKAVEEERIYDALDFYVSYRRPQIRLDKLKQIGEGTEYYVIEEVRPLRYYDGGNKADVYVRVRQKPVHSSQEQVWEGVWIMEKENGEWKIVRTPGRRIR